MKDKRVIIVIIIVLALVLGFSIYFVYTNIKQSDLITKDTLFLCPGEDERYHAGNNGILELVKASDNKHENEVCDGKFVGKYVCTNKDCGYDFGSQWFSWYSDYNKGVATIYDTNEETYVENGFCMILKIVKN